jgi:hypothetical protein
MTIEEAIKKANDGGWRPTYFALPHLHNVHCNSEIFLDPSFWKSLDKTIAEETFLKSNIQNGYYEPHWKELWHRFIDHLAAEKSTEEFFHNLAN